MNATNDTYVGGVLIVMHGENTRMTAAFMDSIRSLNGCTTPTGMLIGIDDMTFELEAVDRAMHEFMMSADVVAHIDKIETTVTDAHLLEIGERELVFKPDMLMPYIPAMPAVARSQSDVRGDFVVRGGRIVKVWNPWHSIWEFWTPKHDVKCQPIGRAKPCPVRSGCPPMNRGRHRNWYS